MAKGFGTKKNETIFNTGLDLSSAPIISAVIYYRKLCPPILDYTELNYVTGGTKEKVVPFRVIKILSDSI